MFVRAALFGGLASAMQTEVRRQLASCAVRSPPPLPTCKPNSRKLQLWLSSSVSNQLCSPQESTRWGGQLEWYAYLLYRS